MSSTPRITEAQEIGARIREARKAHRLTLEGLASVSGVNKSNLSRAETGRSLLSGSSMDAIAKHLGPDIFSGTSPANRVVSPRSTLIQKFAGYDIRALERLHTLDGESTYVVTEDMPSVHLRADDLLIVDPEAEYGNYDLLLVEGSEGISLLRTHHFGPKKWTPDSKPMWMYELTGYAHQTPQDPGTTLLGVVVEVRRTRAALTRRRRIQLSMDPE